MPDQHRTRSELPDSLVIIIPNEFTSTVLEPYRPFKLQTPDL
jgi:hypothetical protein